MRQLLGLGAIALSLSRQRFTAVGQGDRFLPESHEFWLFQPYYKFIISPKLGHSTLGGIETQHKAIFQTTNENPHFASLTPWDFQSNERTRRSPYMA